MLQFFPLLFSAGLLFLLTIVTGLLPFAQAPMLAGQGVLYDGIASTGAANLVTAVVLGYRGIDTLMELTILFAAAAAGSLAFSRVRRSAGLIAEPPYILDKAIGFLLPLLLVTGFYVILHGHLTPGGGFQGGVLLASAIFLPVLSRSSAQLNHEVISLIEGLAGVTFIVIGLLALYQQGAFLQPLFDHGVFGSLLSAGSLPVLYLAVGLKVGAELAGLLSTLAAEGGEDGTA